MDFISVMVALAGLQRVLSQLANGLVSDSQLLTVCKSLTKQDTDSPLTTLKPLSLEPVVNPLERFPAQRMLTLLPCWGIYRTDSKQAESVVNMWAKEARRDQAASNAKPKPQSKARGQEGALASARIGLAAAEKRLKGLRSSLGNAANVNHKSWILGQIKSEESKVKRLGRKVYAIERDLFKPGRKRQSRARA